MATKVRALDHHAILGIHPVDRTPHSPPLPSRFQSTPMSKKLMYVSAPDSFFLLSSASDTGQPGTRPNGARCANNGSPLREALTNARDRVRSAESTRFRVPSNSPHVSITPILHV
jgi:hypothetical protein